MYFCVANDRVILPFKPRMNACRDTYGNLITNKKHILVRWRDHFNVLLNDREMEEDRNGIEVPIGELEPPDLEEVKEAIQ